MSSGQKVVLRLGLFALVTAVAPAAAMSVNLVPSVASPAPVGAMVSWSASVSDAGSGTLWYRFRARRLGHDYHMIRDYGPGGSLDWTEPDHEGTYEIEVSVRNRDTGDTAETSAIYEMLSRVTDTPVVNPTSHPLVFLYSAPPCHAGSRMRVQFGPAGSLQYTPFAACAPGRSMNFYLAGLYPNTQYFARHIIDDGFSFTVGPDVSFETSDAPADLMTETVLQVPPANASNQILLGSAIFTRPVATDLGGKPVWYGPSNITFITRPEPGGRFWGIGEFGGDESHEIVRKFDLTGMTLLETNAARVNEQLAAMGRRAISSFHHEARTLPDGRIVVLATVEQILSDVQGPGPVDIIGDMIIVFDQEMNVVWAWDAFDYLDVTRAAVLGETCSSSGACSSHYLASDGNDWTHGNSVQQTPDGNLLYSSRHQDWLIKISYDNGEGDGHIIWRLGKDGDFQFDSNDPYPWFSHQHDANFEYADPATLLVFDDGNTRVQSNGGNSRGQVLKIDETNRVASFVLNADLGVFSLAVGSAQRLRDGNYHFDAGWVYDDPGSTNPVAYSYEVDPTGKIVYGVKAPTALYRSFRMTDMYTPR